MQVDRIARSAVSLLGCALLAACSDAAGLLSRPDASEAAAIVADVAPPALAVPANTGAWWTYSVDAPHANYRSVQRIELGEELAPGHFAVKASVLAANAAAEPAFPYVAWRFGSTFTGTTSAGTEVTFFAPGRRWAGPGLSGHFAETDVLAASNATALYPGQQAMPTLKVEVTSADAGRPNAVTVEEHYATGVGFVAHSFRDCSGTKCVDSTIKLVAWSFRQSSSEGDRRCRDDLTGAYDNGVSLTQVGTIISGAVETTGGASGVRVSISGTRTASSVSLRYVTKSASGEMQGHVIDYAIHRTGLALEPTDPADPQLMRTCPLGEL